MSEICSECNRPFADHSPGGDCPVPDRQKQMDTMDEAHAHEVMDEQLQWEPGTLTTRLMERVLMDVFADLWCDCYRRDDIAGHARVRLFTEKVVSALNAATGQKWILE